MRAKKPGKSDIGIETSGAFRHGTQATIPSPCYKSLAEAFSPYLLPLLHPQHQHHPSSTFLFINDNHKSSNPSLFTMATLHCKSTTFILCRSAREMDNDDINFVNFLLRYNFSLAPFQHQSVLKACLHALEISSVMKRVQSDSCGLSFIPQFRQTPGSFSTMDDISHIIN